MDMMIERTADEAERYELKSDGVVAEIEDKLFMIFTYGPDDRYYLADIYDGKIVAAISMGERCRCVLAYDEDKGWRLDSLDENGKIDGSIRLCRTGIDLDSMGKTSRKRVSKKGDVPRVSATMSTYYEFYVRLARSEARLQVTARQSRRNWPLGVDF